VLVDLLNDAESLSDTDVDVDALSESLVDVLVDLLNDADALSESLVDVLVDLLNEAESLSDTDVDVDALSESLVDVLVDLLNDADSLAATDWLLEIDCDFATLAERLNDVDFSSIAILLHLLNDLMTSISLHSLSY
ncbi:hypothetical protein, partial [Staphylococcus pseudintermedius]|uniref:hypothetical protein n=1 Tax=Staphylococcus pseudintermedius TaxID=283734 RepID=UPI0028FD0DA7